MACSDAGSGATSPLSIAESDDKDTGLKFDRIMPRRIRNYDRSAIALNKKTAKRRDLARQAPPAFYDSNSAFGSRHQPESQAT
jgi:hypothetical protein